MIYNPPKNIPKINSQIARIDQFRGVDFTDIDTQVSLSRSPDCQNMVPALHGFPVKRKGYHLLGTLQGRVNGAYRLITEGKVTSLIHAGTKLYKIVKKDIPDISGKTSTRDNFTIEAEEIYGDMADEKSRAAQVASKLMIVDGKRLLVFGEFDGVEKVRPADTCGTPPLICIGRNPDGSAAKSYNPYNILTQEVMEDFLADGKSTDFVLSYPVEAEGTVTVKERNENGEWIAKDGFTVERETGIVHFTSAPVKPAAEGEDNIKIKYPRKKTKAAIDALRGLNSCKTICAYGIDGQPDRMCCGTEVVRQNRMWYSQWQDPLYVGDTWYILPGQERAGIVGFGVLGRRLLVYKEDEEYQRNVYMIETRLSEAGDAQYPIAEVTQGENAISMDGMVTMDGEPLMLTQSGVLAITSPDNGTDRYLQERSHYIAEKMTREENLDQAEVIKWNRFCMIAVNGKVYLMDSAQKSYSKDSPHSAYQYECYYWTNVPARKMWEWDNMIWFGDKEGNIYAFFTGETSNCYMDNGKAIDAYWSTPLMNLGSWEQLKTVTNVWVVLQPYTRSSATVRIATDKKFFYDAKKQNLDIFDWDDIDFERFTFNTLDRPMVMSVRKKEKKIKMFQMQIRNNIEREPFGISAISIKYRRGGEIKE